MPDPASAEALREIRQLSRNVHHEEDAAATADTETETPKLCPCGRGTFRGTRCAACWGDDLAAAEGELKA